MVSLPADFSRARFSSVKDVVEEAVLMINIQSADLSPNLHRCGMVPLPKLNEKQHRVKVCILLLINYKQHHYNHHRVTVTNSIFNNINFICCIFIFSR